METRLLTEERVFKFPDIDPTEEERAFVLNTKGERGALEDETQEKQSSVRVSSESGLNTE